MQKNLFYLIILLVLQISLNAGEKYMKDPYKILNKYYEEIGGLENLSNIRNQYFEAKFELIGTGMEGTFQRWSAKKGLFKQNLDLKIIKQVSGNNGFENWSLDNNGNLQTTIIDKDSDLFKLEGLKDSHEFLNPESRFFHVSLEGIEDFNGEKYYKIKISNNLDNTSEINFYNTSTYLLEKQLKLSSEGTITILLSDYKEVSDGIKMNYYQETITTCGQKQVIEKRKIEINSDFDYKIFNPPSTSSSNITFLKDAVEEEISMKFEYGNIYIEADFQGIKGWWILDSGATNSVIFPEKVKEFGLQSEGKIQCVGANGSSYASFTKVPSFLIGNIRVEEMQMVTSLGCNPSSTPLDSFGILGYDFLSNFTIKIDYAEQVVTFYNPDVFNYKGDGIIFDNSLNPEKMFVIPMEIDGKYAGEWTIDLGASVTTITYPFAEQNNFFKMSGVKRVASGATSDFILKFTKFNNAAISNFIIENPILTIPINKGDGFFAREGYCGNIGNSLLRNFNVYLDYKNNRIILEKGLNYNTKPSLDRSGLQLRNDTDGIVVRYVSENSPAEKSGFQKGDIIKKINDLQISYFRDINSIRDLFCENRTDKLNIQVLRNDTAKKLTIKLKDLFE